MKSTSTTLLSQIVRGQRLKCRGSAASHSGTKIFGSDSQSQGFVGWDWCSHLGKKLCKGGLAPGFCFNVTQQLLELLQLESVITAAQK